MFLPMSWMSPVTVPMATTPSDCIWSPVRITASSINLEQALPASPAAISSGRKISSASKRRPTSVSVGTITSWMIVRGSMLDVRAVSVAATAADVSPRDNAAPSSLRRCLGRLDSGISFSYSVGMLWLQNGAYHPHRICAQFGPHMPFSDCGFQPGDGPWLRTSSNLIRLPGWYSIEWCTGVSSKL